MNHTIERSLRSTTKKPVWTQKRLKLKGSRIYPAFISKLLTVLLFSVVSLPSAAAGIDATINAVMRPITNAVASFIFFEVNVFGSQLPLIILWLIGASVFFTFYFKNI